MTSGSAARRTSFAALAAGLCLFVTACGSTVAVRGQSQLGESLDQQATLAPGALPGGGQDVAPGSASSGGAGGPIASQGGTGTSLPGSVGTGTVQPGGSGAALATRSTAPIEVGFIAGKCSNCSTLGTGYTAPTYSDQQLEQAVVNGINARGGIAGRKIKPVFAVVDTASPSWGTDYQAACSTFTQDHHVVAVLGYSFAYMENLAACLSKAGVLWINGGYSGGDVQAYQKYRYYFTSSAPSEDIELVVSVSSAVADGWVTPKSKLGILQAACPSDVRAFNNSLKPYIAAHHLNLVSNQTINCVGGAQDDGNAAAFIQHAELQMRADGVDNVIITGIPLILFGENAESQQWHPHYLTFLGGAAYEPYLPADQLANIHAAGWMPMLDVNPAHYPALSAQQRDCKALLHQGGAEVPPAQYISAFIACDDVLLYARAVSAAAGDASPAAVSRALEGLGTGYASAVTVTGATRLSSGQHDAPSGFRSNLFNTACKCFLYAGPVRPFPAV